MDPLSVVSTILTVVQMIGSAASTASQNRYKCLELAERAQTLAHVLPSFACAAASDTAMARVLERLKDAVGEALRLIQSCQSGGIFSGKYSSGKAAELESVDKRINNCITDLNLVGQARANHGAAAAGFAQAPAHVHHSSSYYQAQGSSVCVGWATPPQQAWGTSQGYYQQPPAAAGYAQYPAPYYPAASPPAPSDSNLSSLYTLPTVNKIFDSMFR